MKACGAGDSIKPGVERQRNPRYEAPKADKPVERASAVSLSSFVSSTSIVPAPLCRPLSRADVLFFQWSLGLRCAPPQALCCHPLRGLIARPLARVWLRIYHRAWSDLL